MVALVPAGEMARWKVFGVHHYQAGYWAKSITTR